MSVASVLKGRYFNCNMNDKKRLALKHEEQDQLRELIEQGPMHSDGHELGMERRPSALWNVNKKNYRNEIQVMSAIL